MWFNLKIRTNFALFFRNLNRKTHRQRTNDRFPFDGIRIWCDNQNICSFGVFGIFVVINLSLCVSMGMSLRARVHVATTKDHLFWLLLPECPSIGSYVRACDKRLNNMRQPKRIIGVWLSIFELNPHERTKNDAVEMRHVYMCNACPHIEFVWQNSMLLKFKLSYPFDFCFSLQKIFHFCIFCWNFLSDFVITSCSTTRSEWSSISTLIPPRKDQKLFTSIFYFKRKENASIQNDKTARGSTWQLNSSTQIGLYLRFIIITGNQLMCKKSKFNLNPSSKDK